MKITKGLKFKVVKSGLIGEVMDNGGELFGSNVYTIAFTYENGKEYMTATVYEDTIINNVKYGTYDIIK